MEKQFMFYNWYQVYQTINPIVYDGKLNLAEIIESIQLFIDKHNVIPAEGFISNQFNECKVEFKQNLIKLIPTNSISSSREFWIGVNPIV